MSRFAIAGVLEGFYGKPWSWDDRVAIMERCVPAGLPWYVWAPKSDPLHRKAWREPFTEEHLAGFSRLLTVDGLRLGIAVAPGLDLQDPRADAAILLAKVQPVIDLGARLIMVAFDDIANDSAERHGEFVNEFIDLLANDDVQIIVVPTHYATIQRTEYLETVGGLLPPEVMMAWTGAEVVNDHISVLEAESFAEAVYGRSLALWDNYPVNDAFLSDRLFLMPLEGRERALDDQCGAYFANAGVQPWCSLPALLSQGAWCTSGVAEVPWEELDDPVNTALLAELCDGRELFRLAGQAVAHIHDHHGDEAVDPAGSKAIDDLWWWLEKIEDLEVAGPIGEEAAEWIEQGKLEAAVALSALELLEREPSDPEALPLLFSVFQGWPKVRRGPKSVFGPRFSFQPRASVDSAGNWATDAASLIEGRNATDVLCRAALAKHQREKYQ